ncbi:DUF4331 domain-containing protein [Caenimonas koreensis]|uniref:DUF4331 domain-containing protein n=1 Tax=Caenimonas koreensis DSM 17982 TaxID=1121255 RepID=A0A844AYJ0_9BURK|nr:DUF4331 domain-containing protein [Caenimonas koreensis]MRD49425.1 DUF4331 domain-containing protein [Caenimonas koreensis DSM 17982]
MRIKKLKALQLGLLAVSAACAASTAFASSHREAPFITTSPKVDATDFYMFRSYEGVAANGSGGRSDYVTMIANYQPLQGPYGGPNYFSLDPNALYEIHIDNNGDAAEDITFQFRFNNKLNNVSLPIGTGAAQKSVAIPLIQAGPVANVNDANLNLNETYSVNVVRGNRRSGSVAAVTKATGAATFEKPVDYIGVKTLGNSAAYATYAGKHIHEVKIPGCPAGKDTGRVFVGQRQEGFAVNLGPIFDLVNAPLGVITNPANINAAAANSIQDSNVTSIALEVHKDCLTAGSETVIGGWTTASLRQARLLSGAPASGHQTSEKPGGAWTQVSRLGQPLVNEVVIGLKDKDKFNASRPSGDGQFLDYVTNPTLPALLGLVLTGNAAGLAPTNIPRTDLATVFLTGITGVNKPATVTPSEMLRLNTAIAPVPFASQNRLAIVGSLKASPAGTDFAGFPNGRRPKDDVVDIALVAMLGGLCMANGDGDSLKLNSIPGVAGVTSACKPSSVPAGAASLDVHDAVDQAVVPFLPGFPYLNTPLPGSQ